MKIKDAILNKISQTPRGTYIMVLAHIRYPEQSNPYKEKAASCSSGFKEEDGYCV